LDTLDNQQYSAGLAEVIKYGLLGNADFFTPSLRDPLPPGGIIHPVFSTGTVIVSIPLLGDYPQQRYRHKNHASTEYWVDDTPGY
jgi:hypothetical protein